MNVLGPKYQIISCFKFAPGFHTENIISALNYTAKTDDIFVVTYPKCGTTWTQLICILLLNDGQLPDIVKSNYIYTRSPFLESQGTRVIESLPPGKRILKTHLPFRLQPYNTDAKYIYVTRNPKDACVSFYYHTKLYKEYEFDGDFHQYQHYWLNGEVECGSYAEHLLSWFEHRNNSNVLFLLYEDMKSNPFETIKRIAKFIDEKIYQKLISEPDLLKTIVEHSDINRSKQWMNEIKEKLDRSKDAISENVIEYNFIRKGIIGDWRNHFNDDENEKFNQWFHEKFDKTGAEKLWNEYHVFD